MTADKPSNLAPKLRFPEFRDAPDWEEVSLGTFLVRAPDYGLNAAAVPFSGTLPTYIRITDINSDGQFAPCPRVSVDIGADEEQYLRDGDIVLARTGASVGKSYRYREEDGRLVYAGFLIRVRPNPQRLLSQFLAAYLSTGSYWDWVRLTSARSGQPGINGAEYASMPLPLPPNGRALAEQQKIANCLGSLDDLIAADGRKLEALRQHKQGLVQQLFPRPGESVPRLRFPEFEDAPEWESRELGLMTSKIGSGVTPRGGEKNYRSSGRPFVRSQNVGWGELILDNVVHIDEDTHASFAATEVEEGDVLLNISGASIGRTAVADARIVGGNVNQHVCVIRGLSEQIHPWFLSQYLISKHGQDQIDSCQAGGNRQGLNFGQIRSFLIPQPRDVAEQERIADCLCAADIIRATYAQRIGALKRQKQGLLQQLFPSLEG